MKAWAILFVLILAVEATAQVKFDASLISREVSQFAGKIAQVNSVMNNAVGAGGIRTEQYDNFFKLQKTATQEELIALTNYPNGVVRCYAFWALLSPERSAELFPILLQHLSDTEIVETLFGCNGHKVRVIDFWISMITSEQDDPDLKKLTPNELAGLDSILICTKNDLNAQSWAIERATPAQWLYPRVRELVRKEHNPHALVALARYQKKQDIRLILKFRQKNRPNDDGLLYNYRAMAIFPDPAFRAFLETNLQKALQGDHWNGEWAELYKTIAVYNSEWALNLLNKPFTQVKTRNLRKYHIEQVLNALHGCHDPIYDGLLWMIWEQENKILPDVYKYLVPKNPEKALAIIKEILRDSSKLKNSNFFFLEGADNEDDPGNLLATMLDWALEQDRDFGLEAIRTNIERVDVLVFPFFANKAAEIKDESFIEPLLNRLEKEDNPNVYLKAVEVLLTYHNTGIKRRILEIREKNKNLSTDWGGKALDYMLEKDGQRE